MHLSLSNAKEQTNGEALPEGVFHYENDDEVPQDILNYFQQRYTLFLKYDEGIWMTNDAWFGVTAEPVANKIAQHMAKAAPPEKTILIDTFAGVGGNTIAFALSGRWSQIFAIEKDKKTLECAKHNAKVYGVANRIVWHHGDCFDILTKRMKHLGKDAVIFGSPPWGGPGYRGDEIFDLSTMEPYSLEKLYCNFSKIAMNVALFLPRTSNLNQLAEYHDKEEAKLQVVHYCVKGLSKALCAYYGEFGEI